VIDEADRLLGQSFQDWLRQVLRAIHSPQLNPTSPLGYGASDPAPNSAPSYYFPVADAVAPAWLPTLFPGIKTDIDETTHSSCQKLLFSATLTRDPAKIAQLELRDPKYFIVRRKSADEEQGDEMDVDADATIHEENFDTPASLRVRLYLSSIPGRFAQLLTLGMDVCVRVEPETTALILPGSQTGCQECPGVYQVRRVYVQVNAPISVFRGCSISGCF
jgi:DEAD/DEAH box helicase